MAESNYIKTVAFGGYDKADVNNRFNYLYEQIYELKNALRETKQIIDESRKGTEEEKIHESILASERAKLTMVQVQNESLSAKLKEVKEALKTQESENEALNIKVKELSESLADADSKIDALTNGGATSLSKVFIEAQKSADMLVADSKRQAEEIETNCRTLVQNMIAEANNEAAKIVYEAEKEAALKRADALNEAEQMKVASGNLKAVLFEDVKVISADLQEAKAVFEAALSKVQESEELLAKTTNKLNNEGIPVFKIPETIRPEMPESPVYQNVDNSFASAESEAESKKRKEDLDKLLAMANSIDEDFEADAEKASPEKAADNKLIDIEALARQAQELESL